MLLKYIPAKLFSWVRITRIQFYPMPWIAYSLGAMAAFNTIGEFNLKIYWVGYLAVFFIEVCTVLANEYNDITTDKINKNQGFFNGGSQVLIEGKLELKTVKKAIFILLFVVFCLAIFLLYISPVSCKIPILFLLSAGLFFGLGYSIPPLKFSYRGAGEIVVGLTTCPLVIVCGYTFQSGSLKSPFPLMLSIPMFFAMLAAITLSGVPDTFADRAVSKRTWAVIFGPRRATLISAFFVSLAALVFILGYFLSLIHFFPAIFIPVVLFHAFFLLYALFKLWRSNSFNKKINGIMALALFYVPWFGLIPFLSLFVNKR
ncbi:prenyltransferase [Acidobacteriota bacterium]